MVILGAPYRERVLVLAPHADDETLGAGGAICRHIDHGDEVVVAVATGKGPDAHPVFEEAVFLTVGAEAASAMDVLGVTDLRFLNLPAVLLPDQPTWQTNSAIQRLFEAVQPTIVYAPFPYDLHNDHRRLFHAASVAWRPSIGTPSTVRLVLCYEVQSETHWSAPYLEPGFTPNIWIGLTEDQLKRKLDALSRYESQVRPFPDARSVRAVEHLARWRGSQQSMAAAEGFVLVRGLA